MAIFSKKEKVPSDSVEDQILKEVRRAGILSGLIARTGRGEDPSVGLAEMVRRIEEHLEGNSD